MFKSLTFRGFYSGFSRALFAAIFFMFCGIFVAGAYTVTYNCGSASGQPWTGSSDNPTPTQSAINCATSGLLVGYCCQNGDDIHEVGPNQLIPNPSDDVTCKALWAQQRQLSFQYNIGNCSISDPTNLYGTSSSYSVPIQHIYTEHCMGITENVSPNQLAILSPYNSGLNWSPQSSSNIFTSTEDLSNCVNFDYWKDFVNNTTYNCSTGSNGTCGTINVSGAEALFAHCNWTPYSVIYHGCDGTSTYTSPNTVIYGGSFNVLSYADTNLSSTGYTFQNWNTAADGSGTDYAPNASFTMNDCAVSGTTIDLYAKCECDNANNWWWNADNTACVTGYRIQLYKGICQAFSDFEPTYIYTIPTRGAYLDAERTLLMTENENPVQVPYKAPIVIDYNTNAPNDPATNPSIQYTTSPSSVSSITRPYTCGSFKESSTSVSGFVLNDNGYITTVGSDKAKTYSSNKIWSANAWGCGSSHHNPTLTLTGYTHDGWYDNPQGTGTNIDYIGCSGSAYAVSGTLYAHWTPNTYNVVYNPGAHAASGSTAYTDTDGATYDSPYTPLSFGASPISNNMSAGTGYVFVGWTTYSTPTFTNGILNNEYTGDTYWKRDSGLTLYAAYDCDTANGYQWNENHTACENSHSLQYVVTPAAVPVQVPGSLMIPSGTHYQLEPKPAGTGYVCSDWSCTETINNGYIDMPAADVTCTSTCDCDTANGYSWNANHTACENLHHLQYVVTPAAVPVQVPGSLMIPSGTHYQLEPKPGAQGYVCSDWSCTETINNGYIDMPAADVTCTSTCDCDTANGYHHSGAYCDNTYGVSYYKGNCPLGDVPGDDGKIYADAAWWGNPYTVLSPYNSTFPQILADGLSNFSNCVSFNGWNKSGSSTVYNNCGTGTGGDCGSFNFLDTEDVNLYAVCNWTPYSVIYHGCDGTSTYTSPNTVIYGGSFNVLSYADTNLSSTGYTFQNWNTAANGSGTTYAPNDSFTMNDCAVSGTTIDLYAKCNKNTYTLTYVANAPSGTTVTGMPSPNPITLAYGTKHVLATGVAAGGYTNKGWVCKDANNNTVPQFEDSWHSYQLSITMPASNVTCTALWDTNIVYLKWYKTDTDTQQYTDGNPATSCQYMTGAISPLPTHPTRTGYTFAGWKVTGWECDLSVIDATINGNNSYIDGDWKWWADFSYGRLSGESKCIEQNATPEETCSATGTKAQIDAACNFCYCKLTAYTPTNGQQCNVTSTSWQVLRSFTGSCTDSCADWCGKYVKSGLGNNLRVRVLTQSH